ncbi:MAG TPA: hypothetical protein VMV87_05115 [Burkholderiales bacterium]|nr:hypothetical protein [Burkholderiales bacterium]
MCGPSNNAASQAQANAAQQQAQTTAATDQINSLFASPNVTGQYKKLGDATTQYYTNQLKQQQAINNRNLTFAEARNGQTGGSVAADQAERAGQDYTQGVLQASQRGQSAAASLQAQDQATQANLIAMAQGGLNATAGAQEATSALQSNLANAKANATTNAFGNAFGDLSGIYSNSLAADANRKGILFGLGPLYSPSTGTFGSSNIGTAGSTL